MNMNKLTIVLRALLLLLGAWSGLCSHAHAAEVTLALEMTPDRNSAGTTGEIWSYNLKYQVSSTSFEGKNVKVVVIYDAQTEYVSATGSSHTTGTSWNAATRQLTFTMKTPLTAGATGELNAQARFKAGTAGSYVSNATATISADNGTPVSTGAARVTSWVPSSTVLTFKDGVYFQKNGWAGATAAAGLLYYNIYHGNTSAALSVTNYVIEDNFPANFRFDYFASGRFPGTSLPVNIQYKTNLNTSWRNWSRNPGYNSGTSVNVADSQFGLAAGEYITGLRWLYGTVPGGGAFHSSVPGVSGIQMYLRAVDKTKMTTGLAIQNCASLNAGAYVVNGCATTTVAAPSTSLGFWAWDGTGKPRYNPGDQLTLGMYVQSNPNNSSPIVDPAVGLLLAPQFEYVGSETVFGDAWSSAGSPAPAFTVINDFGGTGRQLVRWKWKGWSITPNGGYPYVGCSIQARVKAGTPYGLYRQDAYGGWNSPVDGCAREADLAADIDADGVAGDSLCRSSVDINVDVDPGGGLAVVDSQTLVKGELDADWIAYPGKGLSAPGGKADYRLVLKNTGGVVLTNMTMIDILPKIGDKGVIDTNPRGSQWSPYLAGPVVAPPGVTVSYSLSSNPCRDELTPGLPAGCQTPNWTTTPPADITTVASLKIDFGSKYLLVGESATMEWPMRVPLNAPFAGEVAWNSFGYIAKRKDNGRFLLPSEPNMTGIAVVKPKPPYFGDHVWGDKNRNGIQDAGEKGMNGVRVELYQDDGDGKIDLGKDKMTAFSMTFSDGTAEGAYLFTGLTVGASYYAAFYVPTGFVCSPANQGANDALDSDGIPLTFGASSLAVTGLKKMGLDEIDLTQDMGFIDRTTLPAVWSMAEQPDGKLVIGGRFQSVGGLPRANLARVLPNGKLDTAFLVGSGCNGEVVALDVMKNGNILVGGKFTSYNGTACTGGLIMLKPDGSVAKVPLQPVTPTVASVCALPSGKIMVGGSFAQMNGYPIRNLCRLNADGSFDTLFSLFVSPDGPVSSVKVMPNGKLAVAGGFTSLGGYVKRRLAKLTQEGDNETGTTSDKNAGPDKAIDTVAALPDGSLVTGGGFTTYDGKAVKGYARIDAAGKLQIPTTPPALNVISVKTAD